MCDTLIFSLLRSAELCVLVPAPAFYLLAGQEEFTSIPCLSLTVCNMIIILLTSQRRRLN